MGKDLRYKNLNLYNAYTYLIGFTQKMIQDFDYSSAVVSGSYFLSCCEVTAHEKTINHGFSHARLFHLECSICY